MKKWVSFNFFGGKQLSLKKVFVLGTWAGMVVLSSCGENRPKISAPKESLKDPPVSPKGDTKAEKPKVANWFTKSPELEKVEGTQVDRAYLELVSLGSSSPVIVAVIDGGVDIRHEDLQGRIWVNGDEIPGNGVDDDQNGYVDDVNGWNFLGSQKGNIDAAPLEVTRESVRLKKLKAELEARGETLSVEDALLLEKVSQEVSQAKATAQNALNDNLAIQKRFELDYPFLQEALGVELKEVTLDLLKKMQSTNPEVLARRDALVTYAESVKFTSMARVIARIEYRNEELKYYYNEDFDPRAEIIGDDESNFDDRFYGNPDVAGGDPSHGTHVAGIVGARRGNGLGIDGVADNVVMMPVRAVPNGDEYDKDVANAVRYAVDNGAQIINMSFGKSYSPHKEKVGKAFQYAAERGVLIVHSAGNSSENVDLKNNFPNPEIAQAQNKIVPGWLTVGASAAERNQDLPAAFSNYGSKKVDLFAPGVEILSTVNGDSPNGTYDSYSGTSMAAPVVSGVAAFILAQKRQLKATELRSLLLETARGHKDFVVKLPLAVPGPVPLLTYFGALSVTGGIVDAYAAMKKVMMLN